jgi:hypothetical protein
MFGSRWCFKPAGCWIFEFTSVNKGLVVSQQLRMKCLLAMKASVNDRTALTLVFQISSSGLQLMSVDGHQPASVLSQAWHESWGPPTSTYWVTVVIYLHPCRKFSVAKFDCSGISAVLILICFALGAAQMFSSSKQNDSMLLTSLSRSRTAANYGA